MHFKSAKLKTTPWALCPGWLTVCRSWNHGTLPRKRCDVFSLICHGPLCYINPLCLQWWYAPKTIHWENPRIIRIFSKCTPKKYADFFQCMYIFGAFQLCTVYIHTSIFLAANLWTDFILRKMRKNTFSLKRIFSKTFLTFPFQRDSPFFFFYVFKYACSSFFMFDLF